MNNQEIRDEIAATRQRLQDLEAKLQEPEKWVPKGGDWRLAFCSVGVRALHDHSILPGEWPFRVQTESECKALVKHLKNQAILWQLANDLNEGWVPDWFNGQWDKHYVFFSHDKGVWRNNDKAECEIPSVYFKDEATAKKACDILNNQETGVEL